MNDDANDEDDGEDGVDACEVTTSESKASGAISGSAQESIRDLTKLIVSLGSGVVALSATFIEKLTQGVGWIVGGLFVAWAALALSVIFGIDAMSQLADTQWKGDNIIKNALEPLRKSWLWFKVGMVFLLLYAGTVATLQARKRPDDASKQQVIKCLSCVGAGVTQK